MGSKYELAEIVEYMPLLTRIEVNRMIYTNFEATEFNPRGNISLLLDDE